MTSLPLFAGVAATAIFASSALPMLIKAARTSDLGSYSFGNLALANLGNALYSIYVFSLPPGPLWLLHAFNATTSGLMLGWFVRHEVPRREKYLQRLIDQGLWRRSVSARRLLGRRGAR